MAGARSRTAGRAWLGTIRYQSTEAAHSAGPLTQGDNQRSNKLGPGECRHWGDNPRRRLVAAKEFFLAFNEVPSAAQLEATFRSGTWRRGRTAASRR